MPLYRYKAVDLKGNTIEGHLDDENEGALAENLNKRNFFLINAKAIKQKGVKGSRSRIKRKELITFTIHLATILEAGISILSGLRDLAEETENIKFRKIIEDICRQIEAGTKLSDAFARYPKIFPETYISIVKAGETTGKLEKVLHELVSFLEWQEELSGQIKQSTTYPIVVLSLIATVGIIMLTYILPNFITIFKSLNVTLPLPTRVLIGTSNLLTGYWYILPISVVVFFSIFTAIRRNQKGRYIIDYFLLNIPIFGNMIRKIALSRFAHYLGVMYKSGINIVQALSTIEIVVGNLILAKVVSEARERVVAGENLTKPLKESGEFPPLVIRMLAIGEETGLLDESLGKVSKYYDQEVSATIKKLFTVLEPLIIIVLGGIVVLMALSIILPIYSISSQIR